MRRGFSLVEVVLALLIFQVGIMAIFGMVLLSQRNFQRAEVTLRGVLEAGWIADSLFGVGSSGNGSLDRPWGKIEWSEESTPVPGIRFSVWSPVQGDTLVRVFSVKPPEGVFMSFPDPSGGGLPW
jgi:hypothetical protein